MNKIIVIFLTCFLTCLPVYSKIITGGVEVSVEDARGEVLSGERETLNQQKIINNFKDPKFNENQSMLLKGITELNDRKLAKFSDGSYAVMYYDDRKNTYYYSSDGTLTHNEIRTGTEYPYKAYKYSTNGELVNMSLKVSEKETFIFTPKGKLLAHWLGEYCYDEDKNIIMTRKIYH